jgi:hypothetical protein
MLGAACVALRAWRGQPPSIPANTLANLLLLTLEPSYGSLFKLTHEQACKRAGEGGSKLARRREEVGKKCKKDTK